MQDASLQSLTYLYARQVPQSNVLGEHSVTPNKLNATGFCSCVSW